MLPPRAAGCLALKPSLALGLGHTSRVPSSVPLARGGGESGRVMVGATQPDVEIVPLEPANCLNTSLRTGSTGHDSKGRAKRAT